MQLETTMLLKDKIAVITGAASKRGLGQATARLFAEHGAKVAILDLDEAQARLAASGLPGKGHIGFACDVTDRKACLAIAAMIVEQLGRVDILVNNAGISQPLKLMEIKPENYDAVLDVNLRGTLNMTQAVVPNMRHHKSGSIINLSSVSAQRGGGIFGGPHYSAAKGGILGLTKAAARELAPDGIRVNAICPSLIDTDIVLSAPGWTQERAAEVMKSHSDGASRQSQRGRRLLPVPGLRSFQLRHRLRDRRQRRQSHSLRGTMRRRLPSLIGAAVVAAANPARLVGERIVTTTAIEHQVDLLCLDRPRNDAQLQCALRQCRIAFSDGIVARQQEDLVVHLELHAPSCK